MITRKEALEAIKRTALGERHKNYDHECMIARHSDIICNASKQKEFVKNLRSLETDEQKEQRVEVFNSLTPMAISQIKTYYEKIRRAPNIKKTINLADKTKEAELIEGLDNFYDNKNISNFIFERQLYWNFKDANGVLIFERRDVKDEQGALISRKCYPIEVTSEQIVNKGYYCGSLDWIIVKDSYTIDIETQERIFSLLPQTKTVTKTYELSNYYFYTRGYSIVLYEHPVSQTFLEDKLNENTRQGVSNEFISISDKEGENEKYFLVSVFEDTGTKEVPFISWGVYKDDLTNGESFVPPYWPSMPLLLDLINLKSEADLVRKLHVFPKLFLYLEKCGAEHPEYGECQGGCFMDGEGCQYECQSCGGSGLDFHISQQDIVGFQMPQGKEDFIPLSEMGHYLQLDTFTPEFIDKLIEKTLSWISFSVFSTDIFDKRATSTATEVNIEHEKIYDRIVPYAEKHSDIWAKGHRVCGDYLETGEGSFRCEFGRDFKMKTLDDLVCEFEKANNAGLDKKILSSMEDAILEKIHLDNPEKIMEIKARRQFKPFSGKTDETVIAILGLRANTDFQKVAWENFDDIFSEIDCELLENGEQPFYLLNFQKQKELFKDKVEEFTNNIRFLQGEGVTDIGQFMIDEEGEEVPIDLGGG